MDYLGTQRERERVVVECENNFPTLGHINNKDIFSNNFIKPNYLIEGDNYHILQCLNYTHKGKIDVIYIDPPYNTGNKDFLYNDKFVNNDDSYRHSKYLNFMEKRLRLAKNLLSNSGSIFISIDDHEQANLKILCDEIFGENNFIKCLIWESGKPYGFKATTTTWPKCHEYILHYAKQWKSIFYKPTYELKPNNKNKPILTGSIIKAKENGTYSMDWVTCAKKESVGFGTGQKPIALIKKLLMSVSKESSTILDFFAGSGTTGVAVDQLNKEDNGKRNFILCTNNENHIMDKFTYPRIKKQKIPIYFYKTFLIPHEKKINDIDRQLLSKHLGELIGIKEDTPETIEINNYYHLLKNNNNTKNTLIYFNEDLYKWEEALNKISANCQLYKFSYEPIEKYKFNVKRHIVEINDIPEPIIKMYARFNEMRNE